MSRVIILDSLATSLVSVLQLRISARSFASAVLIVKIDSLDVGARHSV